MSEQELPRFDSEDEEREFWSRHDSTDYVDWSQTQSMTLPNLKPSTRKISAVGKHARGAQAPGNGTCPILDVLDGSSRNCMGGARRLPNLKRLWRAREKLLGTLRQIRPTATHRADAQRPHPSFAAVYVLGHRFTDQLFR